MDSADTQVTEVLGSDGMQVAPSILIMPEPQGGQIPDYDSHCHQRCVCSLVFRRERRQLRSTHS